MVKSTSNADSQEPTIQRSNIGGGMEAGIGEASFRGIQVTMCDTFPIAGRQRSRLPRGVRRGHLRQRGQAPVPRAKYRWRECSRSAGELVTSPAGNPASKSSLAKTRLSCSSRLSPHTRISHHAFSRLLTIIPSTMWRHTPSPPSQVPRRGASLNSGDVFVLETSKKTYLWRGKVSATSDYCLALQSSKRTSSRPSKIEMYKWGSENW